MADGNLVKATTAGNPAKAKAVRDPDKGKGKGKGISLPMAGQPNHPLHQAAKAPERLPALVVAHLPLRPALCGAPSLRTW